MTDAAGEEAAQPGDLPNAPASDTDSLSALQWDMRQMHTPEAHAITGGSPAVVVGDIDTGLDYGHPDLRQNVSDADSANCTSGAPVPGAAAADDDNGHGTHTAGTIAAAANGAGMVGVAPRVRVAGIKAATAGGFFFPEAVVCAFVWAGDRHLDVTNNSYFADPFLFNCRNDAAQRVIWKAEQRAIRYAMNQGVTVVASEGNNSEDLSHPTMDATSPDFPPGSEQTREVTNACVVIPGEISGVIGVTSTGSFDQGTNAGDYPDHLKAYYSSYGMNTADVAAARRRLLLPQCRRPCRRDQRVDPVDVAGDPAVRPECAGANRGGHLPDGGLLLSAGHVDGRPARRRSRCAGDQPVRRPEHPAERQDALDPGGADRHPDRRSAVLPGDSAERHLRLARRSAVLAVRRFGERRGAAVPGIRHRPHLVVRHRGGRRAGRSDQGQVERLTRAIKNGAGRAWRGRPRPLRRRRRTTLTLARDRAALPSEHGVEETRKASLEVSAPKRHQPGGSLDPGRRDAGFAEDSKVMRPGRLGYG